MARIRKPPGAARDTAAQRAARVSYVRVCVCNHAFDWHTKPGIQKGAVRCGFPGCGCTGFRS